MKRLFSASRGLHALVASLLLLSAAASGTVWDVDTVSELNSAISSLGSGDEVIIQPGTYNTGGFYITTPNITIRGATGNRDDVILYGGGMNNPGAIFEGIQLVGDNQTLKDFTLEGYYHHAIHFQPGADNSLVQNVKTLNIGEHHMKGGTSIPNAIVGGIIENSLMMQTEVRQNGLPNRPDNYLGGIDLLGATNWRIRDNVAIGIEAIDSGDAAIFLWQRNTGHIIERNVLISNNKGIAMGNPMDTNMWQVENTIVRNNIIVRDPSDEIGMEACYTKDLKVYNNTVYSPDASYFRTLHILDQAGEGATTNLQLVNNIIRGNVLDNTVGGGWTPAAIAAMGNIFDTTGTVVLPAWFVDAAGGDLHLSALATAAIDQASTLAEVTDDMDALARPVGSAPDMGADEYGSDPPPPPPDYPTVEHTVKYLGGGKYGVSFTIHGNDDPVLASFFANMTFEGTAGGQIQQVQALGSFDVDNETDADSWDGLGDPPYDKDADSWFGDPFAMSPPASIVALTEAANYYHIEAGTGGGSAYENADLAYIVTTGDVAYYGVISRLAENYDVSAIAEMPLPGDANEDGSVDGADYTIWADNYQSGGVGWGGGDFNGDDVVDGGDYTIWADFYTGGGAIPEPATLTLLALGTMVMLRRRRPPGPAGGTAYPLSARCPWRL